MTLSVVIFWRFSLLISASLVGISSSLPSFFSISHVEQTCLKDPNQLCIENIVKP